MGEGETRGRGVVRDGRGAWVRGVGEGEAQGERTCAALASKAMGAVVYPLKVRRNDPPEASHTTRCFSVCSVPANDVYRYSSCVSGMLCEVVVLTVCTSWVTTHSASTSCTSAAKAALAYSTWRRERPRGRWVRERTRGSGVGVLHLAEGEPQGESGRKE